MAIDLYAVACCIDEKCVRLNSLLCISVDGFGQMVNLMDIWPILIYNNLMILTANANRRRFYLQLNIFCSFHKIAINVKHIDVLYYPLYFIIRFDFHFMFTIFRFFWHLSNNSFFFRFVDIEFAIYPTYAAFVRHVIQNYKLRLKFN